MHIIPVLDLKDGLVVHAVHGNRQQYQPIHEHSILTNSSDIKEVIRCFLQLHAFQRFYIADLNAICQQGHHQDLLADVLKTYPDIEFWLDQGQTFQSLRPTSRTNQLSVIGSESQQQAPEHTPQNYILSLDYHQERQLGHEQWFTDSQYWPDTIIIMTLNRVGSGTGPDFAKLRQFIEQFPDKQIIAAGGIRNQADIQQLSDMGVSGALIATALHDGRLGKQALV